MFLVATKKGRAKLKMKCFPFFGKRKVAPRLTVAPINKRELESTANLREKKIDRQDDDCDYVTYEAIDTKRKGSDSAVTRDGVGSTRAISQRCDAQISGKPRIQIEPSGFQNDSKTSGDPNLASLGRKLTITRSFHNYIQEAKRKQLPPLTGSKKRDQSGYDNRDGFRQDIRGLAGANLFLVKKSCNREEKAVHEEGNTTAKRKLVVDITLPGMMVPDHRSAKPGLESIEDDWSSIEDILAIDLPSQHKDQKENKIHFQGSLARSKLTTRNMQDTVTQSESTESFDSSCRLDQPINIMNTATKQEELFILYDDDEIELMESIEKQFIK